MSQLVIQVRGEVLETNFSEWKESIIGRIRSVVTELNTEEQFAQASDDVKQFKAAESALKDAKAKAISQASDIQQLFSAIDEVSAEVRQVRLILERQIKQRKSEIKEELIDQGIKAIQDYIAGLSEDFRSIDHSVYLDRAEISHVIKGRRGVEGVSTAIDQHCDQVKRQIEVMAACVANNAARIDSMPVGHKALFQDRPSLLALHMDELNKLIDQRIAVLTNESIEPASNASSDSGAYETESSATATVGGYGEKDGTDQKSLFTLTIEIYATESTVKSMIDELRSRYNNDGAIRDVRLAELATS